jgi:hypothetical protein
MKELIATILSLIFFILLIVNGVRDHPCKATYGDYLFLGTTMLTCEVKK